MKQKDKRLIQKKALAMYLTGMSKTEVSERCIVSFSTIQRWERALGWKDKLKEVESKIDQEVVDSAIEMKERHIKIIRATIAKYIDNLRSKDFKVSAAEARQMLEHEMKIVMPQATQNTLNMSYTQNIINVEALERARTELLRISEQRRKERRDSIKK